MMQTPHVNQRHASCNRQLWIGEIAPQYLVPHVRAETNGKLKEITRKDTQPSKLDYPKVQKNDLCSVPKTLFAQAIKQQNSQEIPTGFQQFMPSTPRDKHLPQEELRFYKHYLKKRMQDTQYAASGLELFKEIQAKGYRGSPGSVKNFLSTIRRNQRLSETRLAFHRDYLIKRMEETRYRISGSQLFKEIQAKGYQGSLKGVENFASTIRQNRRSPKTCLAFHRDYLIKRMEENEYRLSGPELFKEIQAKGYQGSLRSLKNFLSTIRRNQRLSETRLAFHRDYLIKRMEENEYRLSGPELFKEIQAKGYRGSLKNVGNFLSTIRQNRRPPEACLAFYQDYLIKRMEETEYRLSGSQLFKEIEIKGYRGAASTVKSFLSAIRQDKRPPEACLAFHQDYLEKKIERESQTRRTPTLQLFKEIQDRGYRGSIGRLEKKLAIMRKETAIKKTQSAGYLGSIKTVQNFLMTTQSPKRSPEACLGFHRDALIKKIKGMPSHHITGAGLFKDIRSKGYRGSLRTVQRFAATIRKNNHSPEECA